MNPTLTASAQGGKPPKWALYQDFDELKCEVIREAIKARAITDGEVICGDIKQLAANDVRGFKRCHFFAGGGFWDLALNLAEWGDEPCWTGSCPCPSFSSAGKGEGFDDPRHLWPAWYKLIAECRPPVIFGEQSSAAIGFGWLDLVQANMEASMYAIGKIVFGAHSVGAPHIRQRLYFCADSENSNRRRGECGEKAGIGQNEIGGGRSASGCAPVLSHNSQRQGLEGHRGNVREWRGPGWLTPQEIGSIAAAGATRGFWSGCDWWHGRDEGFRPIEPGLSPLAYGSPARVGRLRLYGDAIVVSQAQAFIEAYIESRGI